MLSSSIDTLLCCVLALLPATRRSAAFFFFPIKPSVAYLLTYLDINLIKRLKQVAFCVSLTRAWKVSLRSNPSRWVWYQLFTGSRSRDAAVACFCLLFRWVAVLLPGHSWECHLQTAHRPQMNPLRVVFPLAEALCFAPALSHPIKQPPDRWGWLQSGVRRTGMKLRRGQAILAAFALC